MLVLAALLFLSSLASASESDPEPSAPAWIHCTPTTFEIAQQGGAQNTKHAIARAIANAGAGTVIFLDPGDYSPFSIGFRSNKQSNAATSGGQAKRPIVVEGTGLVRVIGSSGDAIAIAQEKRNGWITFRNITIIPGQRAGVLFFRQYEGGIHRGFAFEDCHIQGGYGHLQAQGRRSKWGIWGHSLADFRFVGVRGPARVEKIRGEHAFYIQNHRGPILIENVHSKELGRTFVQFTARKGEGPPGTGNITIRNCKVIDACIGAGDGYKGGSAFTFAGRLDCTILLEGNICRTGFRKDFRKLTMDGAPFGTGAIMAWNAAGEGPNGTLILRDNTFETANGCGDRPTVSIGGTRKVRIVGNNVIRAGGDHQPALALDPVDDNGRIVSTPNGTVFLAPRTKVNGAVTMRGKEATPRQLARLQEQAETGSR